MCICVYVHMSTKVSMRANNDVGYSRMTRTFFLHWEYCQNLSKFLHRKFCTRAIYASAGTSNGPVSATCAFYRNGWTNRAKFWYGNFHLAIPCSVKKNSGISTNRIIPSGTLSQTTDWRYNEDSKCKVHRVGFPRWSVNCRRIFQRWLIPINSWSWDEADCLLYMVDQSTRSSACCCTYSASSHTESENCRTGKTTDRSLFLWHGKQQVVCILWFIILGLASFHSVDIISSLVVWSCVRFIQCHCNIFSLSVRLHWRTPHSCCLVVLYDHV